jgi:O-antigen ligase
MFNAVKLIEKNTLYVFFFHVALGFLGVLSNFFIIGYIYLSVLFFFTSYGNLKTEQSRYTHLLKFLLYIGSFEMICRIVGCAPLIPYEFSKYLYVFILFFILLKKGLAKSSSIIPLLLSLFSLLFSLLSKNNNIVFSFFGPLSVALVLAAYSQFKIYSIKPILNAVLYPIIVVWTYCYFQMPSFDTLELTRNANDIASGGFGSNQVSTNLGLGTFICFIFVYRGWLFSGNRWIDYITLFGITFQGLMSFSRGGMLGSLLAILIFVLLNNVLDRSRKRLLQTVAFSAILIVTFFVANTTTSGLLLDRYAGNTEGVLAGSKEKTINEITTGRYNIFLGDLELWEDNFITGVGIGNSPNERKKANGMLAHSEFSRLLAEQGLFGLFFFVGWVILGVSGFSNQSSNFGKCFIVACLLLAIYTTFHAAMRTFISPLLTGLSVLIYQSEK